MWTRPEAKWRVSAGFWLVLGVLFYLDEGVGLLPWGLLACLVHELGHLGAAKCLGGHLEQASLTAVGAEMAMGYSRTLSYGEDTVVALAGPAANLVLSVVFAHWFGIAGIFLATMVARLLTTTWMDIFVVFRKGFAQSPWRVYVRTALYAAVMLANMAITQFVLSLITIQGIPGFIVQVIVCSVVCNLLFLVCYCRTKAFGYVWMQFQNLVKMLFRKYISKS